MWKKIAMDTYLEVILFRLIVVTVHALKKIKRLLRGKTGKYNLFRKVMFYEEKEIMKTK